MQKKSKLIVIAIPVIIILAAVTAYQYGYEGIKQEKASVRAMQSTNEKMLEKYIALIAEKPELEKKLAGLKEMRKAEDTKVIEAQTLSIAAASLQETVKTMVTGRGGSITSERVEKPDDLGKMKVINVSIDAVLPDTRALSDLVFGIETHTPYLVIKEIDTRVRNFREPKELMVKLRVSALTGGQ
ncbi:MAG TPA: type II secretion system protein GspM [Syntrophorhabdaceae bacterium]|nr:type II secretion system protein GspM [Syntrophorhabdaceae bacterium]